MDDRVLLAIRRESRWLYPYTLIGYMELECLHDELKIVFWKICLCLLGTILKTIFIRQVCQSPSLWVMQPFYLSMNNYELYGQMLGRYKIGAHFITGNTVNQRKTWRVVSWFNIQKQTSETELPYMTRCFIDILTDLLLYILEDVKESNCLICDTLTAFEGLLAARKVLPLEKP